MVSQARWQWGQRPRGVMGMTVRRMGSAGVSVRTWATRKPSRRSVCVQKSRRSFSLMIRVPQQVTGQLFPLIHSMCLYERQLSSARLAESLKNGPVDEHDVARDLLDLQVGPELLLAFRQYRVNLVQALGVAVADFKRGNAVH